MAAEPTEAEVMVYLRLSDEQKMKEQSKVFDAKKWVWIPMAGMDGYAAAEVKSANGDDVTLKTQKGDEVVIKKDKCEQMNPPKYEKCEDMASLTYLNEASVLHNLRARYVAGMIYTYSGLFCIAVNPYRRLPIYAGTVVKMYRGKRKQEMPPHVFSIVDNAYQDMLLEHDNQSMLITGESGAGKTENTKKVIQYIANVAGVEKGKGTEQKKEGGMAGSLDEQVVQANPLMEAFGNAKTIRNNNSSRFGKFIRCHFSQTGKLAGADIESYLLEKNRVVFQLSAERNYHIFYQLLYATNDELLGQLCLPTRISADYVNLQKGVPDVNGIDDLEEFGLTEEAIVILGFSPDERMSMYKITASILNFGNIKLKQRPRDEQAEVVDPADGERVSFLLGIPVGEFHKSLVKPKVKVGTEYVNKGQNVNQVVFAIGALSKALYERMFIWIVDRVNKALDTKQKRSYFIGVLDIAGFEIFDYNSFDQLCINLTNEKLQQFFNHHMFVLEQEEYKKEGIHWDTIDFGMDLAQTIELVEAPMGVFAMLEEECIVPKATDQTFLQKLHKQHAGNHPSYAKPSAKLKGKGGDFILHHYAGSVGYSVAGWLEKNKDPMNEHTAGLFSKATDPLVSHLFQDYDPDKAGKRKGSAFQTVSFRHKQQLGALLTTLGNTSPHFVRCIIPNETKSPGVIDGDLVLHQLRCNGVLEGIRICRKGFPSRMLFNDFRQRYQILAASAIPSGFVDGKVAVEKLIEALQLDQSEYRVGITKVFFRAGIVGELEDMRDERLSKIISQFQAYCKAHLMRIEYKKMLDQRIGMGVIQRNVRKYLFLRNWTWWKLYCQVLPMLSIVRAEDEMKAKEEELKKAQEKAEADAKAAADAAAKLTETIVEKEKLMNEISMQGESLAIAEEKVMSLQTAKDGLEKSLAEALERLEDTEHTGAKLEGLKKQNEKKIDELGGQIEEATAKIGNLETEKANRDKQIEGLNSNLAQLDEDIAKLGKEKKGVEDNLAETIDKLQTAEDKGSKLAKEKAKVEAALSDTDHNLQREKDAKAKLQKDKQKVEGILKETESKLSDTEASLKDAQDTVVKRDKLIKEQNEKIEGFENQVKTLLKKIAELNARIEELEEELENEKKAKAKTERARQDLEAELESLNEKLEEAGGATAAQLEVSKKRETEIARLRKEMEEANVAADQALAAQKSKFNGLLEEANEEIEAVKKAKAKSDKDKAGLAGELEEATGALETAKKQIAAANKANKAITEQVNELNGKVSELEAANEELEKNPKGGADPAVVQAAVEEMEHKLGVASKNLKNVESALEEAKDSAASESKAKHDAQSKLHNAQHEIEALTEQLEEEQSAKSALQSKLSKATAEAASWKNKYDVEGASRVDELENAKRKLASRVQEMEEALQAAETKAASMEKVKNRMNEEVEDLLIDLEKAQAQAATLDKKQKKVDAQIGEWKAKCDEVQTELEASQKDSRNLSTELLKLRAAHEDASDKMDSLKKENRALTAEISSLSDNMGDGKASAETEKLKRKLELEKEELTLALEEAEIALEQEEAKSLKVQLELSQLKNSSERKLGEKDDEIDNMRKNHGRQLESMQAMIDNESKGKMESAKVRKKFEETIAELESKLDSASRTNEDQGKTIKKLQGQVKEAHGIVDNEARGRDEMREAASRNDRRANDLAVLLDEARAALENSERSRKLAAAENQENADRAAELSSMYNNVTAAKRKAEGDYHALQEEIEALEDDARSANDRANKATAEVARLMAELATAQESGSSAEKSRSSLARQVQELTARAEEAEQNGGKGLKMQIRKLEGKIIELENELDTSSRAATESGKLARRAEKKIKELTYQIEDDSKAVARAQDATEKLNQKCKKMRLQLDEAENQASQWQSKYKKAAVELEESEERSEAAEQALQKARQRARTAAPSGAGTRGGSRAPSGSRTPRSKTSKAGED